MSEEQKCRWESGRRVTRRHLRDCETFGCGGCEPCREDHCRCGRHLRDSEPLTCAKCVGKTRTTLTRIRDLCRLAPVAAAEVGGFSAAAVLAGPVPQHSTHTARHRWAMGGGLCRCHTRNQLCPDSPAAPAYVGPAHQSTDCGHQSCLRIHGSPACPDLRDWLEYADDEQHPLWVLGTWDMVVTEHLGHERTNRVTVDSAAAYLDANLTYLAQHEDFGFDELAANLSTCVEHVERVMGVAEWMQRGAPCPECRADGRKPRMLELHRGESAATDEWRCPAKDCDLVLDDGAYAEHMYRDYLEHADRLTAAQMLAQYRVPEGTLRRWANGWTDKRGVKHAPTVRKHGYDGSGRQLYDTEDVKRMRDVEAA